jgi:hypothetical protein
MTLKLILPLKNSSKFKIPQQFWNCSKKIVEVEERGSVIFNHR